MGISVLMSLYWKERPEFLRQSLISVFGQTLPPDEVVMVLDGPVGEPLEAVLAEFPQLKLVRLAENGGLGRALNEGLRHCSHDIVARMDTDDVCFPNRFELQKAYLDGHPEVDLVGCWIDEFIGSPDNVVTTRRLPESHDAIFAFARKRCPVNHPAVMFRKEAVITCGSYKHFPLFEDYWLWCRMLAAGCRFYNIPQSLLWFRSSADMFRRRGGLKHALTEVRFQRELWLMGFISLPRFVANVGVRFTTRIMPNGLRAWVYKHLLRR